MRPDILNLIIPTVVEDACDTWVNIIYIYMSF